MGDVLTGVIAGLLAQGLAPEAASHAGVYLHGKAADALCESLGPFGFLASEVAGALPGVIREMRRMSDGRCEMTNDRIPKAEE
jgi:NAD(P)H-hydrate epimerase